MVLYDVEWYIRSVVAWVEARGKHVESDQTNLVYTMNYDCQAVFILIFFFYHQSPTFSLHNAVYKSFTELHNVLHGIV